MFSLPNLLRQNQNVTFLYEASSVPTFGCVQVCILWLAGTYSEHLRQVRLPTLAAFGASSIICLLLILWQPETVEFPILIVVTGALAMEQALWSFVVIEETHGGLVWMESALTSSGWLMGLAMQIADFGELTADLVQQNQLTNLSNLVHQPNLSNLSNLTNLVHHQPKNSVDQITVQTDIWTTGQTTQSLLLIPDQSVQSNVAMIFLLSISIVIYFTMRRPSLS